MRIERMVVHQIDDSDFMKNRLLAIFKPGVYEALIREAEVVTLKPGKRPYRQGDHVDAVYFTPTCMVSLLFILEGQGPMEVAMVGREGVVGRLSNAPTLLAELQQAVYAVCCNRLHNMEQHCARWILMSRDRADQDTVPLTQGFFPEC